MGYREMCEKIAVEHEIMKNHLIEIYKTKDHKYDCEKKNGAVTYHTSYLKLIAKKALIVVGEIDEN